MLTDGWEIYSVVWIIFGPIGYPIPIIVTRIAGRVVRLYVRNVKKNFIISLHILTHLVIKVCGFLGTNASGKARGPMNEFSVGVTRLHSFKIRYVVLIGLCYKVSSSRA